MNDWQTIETAPKDGTSILGWNGEEMTVVSWFKNHLYEGLWSQSVPGTYSQDTEWEPTHWMPLPEPPTR
jgi:hypothetical protein